MKTFIKYFLVAILFFFIGYSFQAKFNSSLEKYNTYSKLQQVKDKKRLDAIVMNSPTVYYFGHDEGAGFEYELLKTYTKEINVDLNITVVNTVAEALEYSRNGVGDITSAAITKSVARENKYMFGPSYYQVQQQMICNRNLYKTSKFPSSLEELSGLKILIGKDTTYEKSMQEANQDDNNITYEITDEYSTSQLLEMVANNKIDCTAADSNIFSINQRYYPSLAFAFSLSERESLAWVMREDSKTLKNDMYRWLNRFIQSGGMAKLKDKYYGHINIFNYYNTVVFHKRIKSRLPKYKKDFQDAAKQNDISWIYLAAQSYQESHWNPRAKSHTGVRGMMMLTLPTAKSMGVKSRIDAKQSIYGGAKYLAKMIKRVPQEVKGKDEKMKFALAAYNIGMGHIQDAQVLAKKFHKDPNSWLDVRSVLPLLTQKKYYKQLKFGYARGSEPVRYVDGISEYAQILEQAFKK
ncbi:membrane-bound lytic murein transglycosylase MltF [Sulfurospirillum sp.]|nr:membrane-bound lytic murein transglycosylase MltF [Sulfurospirillum sp.]